MKLKTRCADWSRFGLRRIPTMGPCERLWMFAVLSVGCVYPMGRVLAVSIVYANSPTTASVERVTYGKATFLAVQDGGSTLTSPDGLNWAIHMAGTSGALSGVTSGLAYANTNYVAVGNSSSNGVVQLSADGITWSRPVTIPSVTLGGVIYGSGRYVAVGQTGGASLVTTSTDGITWSNQNFSGYEPLRAVTFGVGTFIAVGDSGAILSSTDGLNWNAQSIVTTNYGTTNIVGVAYGGGIFVAPVPGPYRYFLTSTDGLNWNIHNPLPAEADPGSKVVYGSGRFVGLTEASISTSSDGVHWTYIWTAGGPVLPAKLDIAYGGGVFVTVGEQGVIWDINANYFLANGQRQTEGFFFTVNGGGGFLETGRIQAATNLRGINWVDLSGFTNQGSGMNFTDSGATNHTQRFYRVVSP